MKTCEMPSARPIPASVTKGVRMDLKKSPVATISKAIVTGRISPRSALVEALKSLELASPPVTWTDETGPPPLAVMVRATIERIAKTLLVEDWASSTAMRVVLALGETKEETSEPIAGPSE